MWKYCTKYRLTFLLYVIVSALCSLSISACSTDLAIVHLIGMPSLSQLYLVMRTKLGNKKSTREVNLSFFCEIMRNRFTDTLTLVHWKTYSVSILVRRTVIKKPILPPSLVRIKIEIGGPFPILVKPSTDIWYSEYVFSWVITRCVCDTGRVTLPECENLSL